MIKPKKGKLLTACLSTLLVIASLESLGYLYGIQPSDIAYHHLSFQQEKIALEKKYDISFDNKVSPKNYPSFWLEQGYTDNLVVNLQAKYDFSRFFIVIKNELKKIPNGIIAKHLNHIYAVDAIYLNRMVIGVTYTPDGNIYISLLTDKKKKASKKSIKKLFHHELSSILIIYYHLDKDKWRSLHGDNFLYKSEEDPFYFLSYKYDKTALNNQKALYSKGLLKPYSETGLENDFNTYAEVIFTDPERMKKLIKQYPIIRRKYQIFKEFYLGIDSGFLDTFDGVEE